MVALERQHSTLPYVKSFDRVAWRCWTQVRQVPPASYIPSTHQALGGLLIGTPNGFPNGVGIKFWTGNEPVSQGELLKELEASCKTLPLPITHHPSPTTPLASFVEYRPPPPTSIPFVRFTMPCVRYGLF